jgi:processing peptidase subunit alpha
MLLQLLIITKHSWLVIISIVYYLQQRGADTQMLNMAIRSASTSVAQRSSGGFLSWLTGARSSALPPPDFALAGVTIPDPLPDHVEPAKTKITTLSNGVKIASETSPVCAPYFL